MARGVAGAAARLRSVLNDPGAAQQSHLAQLLARNGGSQFGRDHAFAAIRNEADYASRVPIRTYEALWPWIDAAACGAAGVLTTEPVIVFEETGGSSAGPRLVPYTASGLAEFQAGLHAWLDDLFLAEPGLAEGSFYWSISPACRAPRFTPCGARVGMLGDAAYFGAELAPHIVASLAVPAAVGDCTDLAEWRRQTLLHLLARDDLAMISVWSPTFLTELLGAARADRAALAAALAVSDQAGRAAIVAEELARPAPSFARIWPQLRVISCWDQASARGHAELLRAWFPGVRVQGKGLLATEALVSIPLQGQPFPVLALESGYFEFREPSGRMRTAASVEDGGNYELIISNGSGLYRYAIGDTVRVCGFVGRTPMLEFLGRAGGSDLCGEKLSEAFVQQSLTSLRLHFCALAVDARSMPMHYRLLVDAAEVGTDAARGVAAAIEAALRRNPQYAHARTLGQLDPIDVLRCPNPASRWIELRRQAGQRLGDIKLPVLIVDEALVRGLQA